MEFIMKHMVEDLNKNHMGNAKVPANHPNCNIV